MTQTTLEEFRKKALSDDEVRQEYEALATTHALRRKLVALRKKSGLTQEALAKIMKTQKSNISRLENVDSTSSPNLSTLEEYAKAMGHRVEVNFVPIEERSSSNMI